MNLFMKTNNNFLIYGCGNVGSMFLYNLCLKLKDLENTIKTNINIILIDPGIIKSGELYPFDMSNLIGLNKALAYRLACCDIFDGVARFDTSTYKSQSKSDYFIIDCSDTISKIQSHIKLCCDGNVGKIIINNDIGKNTQTMYSINKSKYYADILSKIAVNMIFDNYNIIEKINCEKTFLFDLDSVLKSTYLNQMEEN